MPAWRNFGTLGAQGVKGGEALAAAIERMVHGVREPVDSERGLAARLRYLTQSPAGYAAMERAGISVQQRTLIGWLSETATPRPDNQARIDRAYWDLRRRNLAPQIKRRLNSSGGTRIEVHPVDQSGVELGHDRPLEMREASIRAATGIWDAAVDAWLAEDEAAMDGVWDDILEELDSDREAYRYVTSVGLLT